MTVEKNKITKAALSRLPRYLGVLSELDPEEVPHISSTRLAQELELGEVQVRKDLGAVCGKGKPRLGYPTKELIRSIKDCLGSGNLTPAVLVGAGKLGRALWDYDEFERYGVQIMAAFDCCEQSFRCHRSLNVLPMAKLEDYCLENNIKIGIITVGEGSAQTVCNRMLACGIDAIWNFAPCKLNVPEEILLRQENLALSLAYLNSQLQERNRKEKVTDES